MGLESILFGAHAEGVRNILAITGDPPEVGDYPGSRGIYEIDAIGLTRLISRLNRGEDFNGRPIDAPTSFFVGVAVNPTADDLELEARPLPAEARGRRAVRDDAARLRPRRARPLLRPLRRPLADPGAGRDLPDLELPPRAAPPQRAAGDRRPGGAPGTAARRGLGAAEVGMADAKELYAAAKERAAGVYLRLPTASRSTSST